jgi:hypothetical protein
VYGPDAPGGTGPSSGKRPCIGAAARESAWAVVRAKPIPAAATPPDNSAPAMAFAMLIPNALPFAAVRGEW